MKICKDGRIWGQNNREAGEHLGVSTKTYKQPYIKKGTGSESKKGKNNPMYGKSGENSPTYGHTPWNKNKHLSKEHKIKISEVRRINEIKRREMGEYIFPYGENHYAWKGGITPLCIAIKRLSEYRKWRSDIFQRDNWTCQTCNKRSKANVIHPHHIKEFAVIVAEFVKIYDQFSPYEDTDILTRLAMKWQPFWDIDNGITLCKECHKLTDSYAGKGKQVKITKKGEKLCQVN